MRLEKKRTNYDETKKRCLQNLIKTISFLSSGILHRCSTQSTSGQICHFLIITVLKIHLLSRKYIPKTCMNILSESKYNITWLPALFIATTERYNLCYLDASVKNFFRSYLLTEPFCYIVPDLRWIFTDHGDSGAASGRVANQMAGCAGAPSTSHFFFYFLRIFFLYRSWRL
jgi:hypothetical protein